MPEERESENPQNVVERKEANTIGIGATSTSQGKISSSLEAAHVRAECIGAELGNEERDLTMAEKDRVLTSSDNDVDDFSAFVAERLQCLSEWSVEKLIAEGSVNVAEILCERVGIGEDGGGNRQSVCPNVTPDEDVGTDVIKYSSGEETDRFIRE